MEGREHMNANPNLDWLSDLPGWQRLLDRHADTFGALVPGTGVGLVARPVADGAEPGDMLVWQGEGGRAVALRRPFTSFTDCGTHLLFVGDPEMMAALHARIDDRPLGAMKLAVREGSLLLYVIKPKTALLDDGFEDFLDQLGLAFLGACR